MSLPIGRYTSVEYEPYAGERRVLWADPDGDQWLLAFYFAVIDGRSEVVGFEMRSFVKDVEAGQQVKATGPPKPLTASIHRRVAFDAMAHKARTEGSGFLPNSALQLMRDLGLDPERGRAALEAADARAVGVDKQTLARGRPRQYDEEHFREVAAVYLKADADGLPATRSVQEYFADKWEEDVTRSQAAKWVYRARHEYELIGETAPRRQGQKQEDQ